MERDYYKYTVSYTNSISIITGYICAQVADSFLPAAEALLRRGSRMMGGLRVKQLVRALSLCIGLFVKHLTLKIEDLSVASGFTPLSTATKSVRSRLLLSYVSVRLMVVL